jgi:hypothetical protein
MDEMRRKGTLSPQNVPSTICTAKRPHVYDMRRKTSTRVRFAVWTFCGVTQHRNIVIKTEINYENVTLVTIMF